MHSHRWVWLHHDDKVRETVEKLFKELEDQLILKDYILSNNKIIRSNAILIARILNSQSVIPTLLELLKADLKDTELLTEVIVALGDLNASESISYLAEMLPTDTESLKTAIIYSLGKLKARQYINTIINSLKDTSIAVRCEAIGALGEFGIEEYIQHLEPFISDVTHVQRTIIRVLGRTQENHNACKLLIEIIELSNDWNIIEEVLYGLKNQTISLVAPIIIEQLGWSPVKEAAVIMAGHHKLSGAWDSLIRILDYKSDETSALAHCLIALYRIDNEKFKKEIYFDDRGVINELENIEKSKPWGFGGGYDEITHTVKYKQVAQAVINQIA